MEKSVFVEVGSWKGRSAAFMGVEILNSGKNIDFVCVDHWRGSKEHKDVPKDLFEQFLTNTKPISKVLRTIRAKSTKAAKQFADRECTFVFIDSGHDFEDVISDIRAWFPKVKVGGIIAGDDFLLPDVRRAVLTLLPNVMVGGRGFWPFWWLQVTDSNLARTMSRAKIATMTTGEKVKASRKPKQNEDIQTS